MLTSGEIFGVVIGCLVFLIMCIVFYNMTYKKPESKGIPEVVLRRKETVRKILKKGNYQKNNSNIDNRVELP